MATLPGTTTVDEIADLARRASEIPDHNTDTNLLVVKLRQDERLEHHNLEAFLDHPNRPRGQACVHDPTDFAEYVNRIGDPERTTVWADVKRGAVTAVINDHHNWADGGWRDHTATLLLQPDEDWVRWHRLNGQRVSQEEFGEFIENVAHTIVNPDAATMLEVATTMTAKRSLDFHQGTRLANGDVQLKFEETTTAAAGVRGDIEIPSVILVRLAPWMGVEPVNLEARLRWRIPNRQLAIGYELLRSDIAARDAFAQLVARVAEGLREEIPVLLGTPPPSIR